MTVIMCAAKNGAVMFNKRRCSSDRAVTADILERCVGIKLCVSTYSAPLFDGAPVKIITGAEELTAGDVVFLEDISFDTVAGNCEKLIVYRWDRVYPAEETLVIPQNFKLAAEEEFAGFSHEKITREVYEK